jgi:hypothetical protein
VKPDIKFPPFSKAVLLSNVIEDFGSNGGEPDPAAFYSLFPVLMQRPAATCGSRVKHVSEALDTYRL